MKGAEANIGVMRMLDKILLDLGVAHASEILEAPDPERAAASLGDVYDTAIQAIDPEAEVDLSNWGTKWPGSLHYHGLEGWTVFWREWLEPWDEFAFTRPRVEADADWVVTEVVLDTRGKGSGVPVQWRFFQVWRFREGRVWRLSTHPTWEKAMAAAQQETS